MPTQSINILRSISLKHNLDYYFNLPKDTVIYVPNLTFNGGTRLIKEAMEAGVKLYKGTARRKTAKERWLKHMTFGSVFPKVLYLEFSNGVRIYDYSRFDPAPEEELTPEIMQPLTELLVNEFNCPKTPTSIVRNEVAYVSAVQNTNQYGAQLEGGWTDDERIFAYQSFYGGAIYNMFSNGAYDGIIDYETHIDFHQLYAFVAKHFEFPHVKSGFIVEPGYHPHPMAIYRIEEGRIRLKKNGFPLWDVELDVPREELYSDWTPIPVSMRILTNPDLESLLENFDVEMTIVETFRYNRSVSGELIFGDFVDKIYEGRKNNTGSVRRFYKLLNEYIAGTFERAGMSSRYWEDLTGPALPANKKPTFTPYNCVVGSFITAYGRRLLSALLQEFPHDKVIGYDTDCVFFHGKPEEVPAIVKARFGDGIGQLHFDGIYHDVRHLAPKQYYGYDENNEVFAKLSGVPNGVEVATKLLAANDDLLIYIPQQRYVWNQHTYEYELTETDSNISFKYFKRREK